MKFGIELELYGYYSNSLDRFNKERTAEFINSLNHPLIICETEYYNGEFEIITKPQKFDKRTFNSVVGELFNILEETSKRLEIDIPLCSITEEMYESIVSIGVHIHISISGLTKYIRTLKELSTFISGLGVLSIPQYRTSLDIVSLISAIAFYEKLMWRPSLRLIHSHHLWGRFRDYSYNFKRKRKFACGFISAPRRNTPIVKPYTIELRVFDVEDLLFYPEKVYSISKKVAKVVKKLIKFDIDDELISYIEKVVNYFVDFIPINIEQMIKCACLTCDYYGTSDCNNCSCQSYYNHAIDVIQTTNKFQLHLPKIAPTFSCGNLVRYDVLPYHYIPNSMNYFNIDTEVL